jgi:hypothetical protein
MTTTPEQQTPRPDERYTMAQPPARVYTPKPVKQRNGWQVLPFDVQLAIRILAFVVIVSFLTGIVMAGWLLYTLSK